MVFARDYVQQSGSFQVLSLLDLEAASEGGRHGSIAAGAASSDGRTRSGRHACTIDGKQPWVIRST